MARKRKPAVPGVLWRMFRNRARTLFNTIFSLLPPPPPSPELCRCNGRRCLGCTADARSFLLRPDDPSHYRKLLTECFVVVSETAPSVSYFYDCSTSPQNKIVCKAIEVMLIRGQTPNSNVLCAGYDRRKSSSHIVELLSCASWCLLSSRVGYELMIYLLKNTSIFLPAPHGKHHQVAGPPINHLCFEMLKRSSKVDHQHPSLHKRGDNKRKRVSEVPMSTRTGTVKTKSELEGQQGSSSATPRLGKRSRPFSWQRRRCKKQKQSIIGESCLNLPGNMLPSDTDYFHASFNCDNTRLSYHEKLQMPWQCSCCLVLQSLPAIPKRTDIRRHPIFYNVESSLSVLPKKHILYSLRPNLACSKNLISNIFGFSDSNSSAQPMSCFHCSGSCLIGSACLYHSLLKWFKHLIRRTQCCQHTKLLIKHCAVPSVDQHTIRQSTSRLQVILLGTDI